MLRGEVALVKSEAEDIHCRMVLISMISNVPCRFFEDTAEYLWIAPRFTSRTRP
jgi:hypothetical protein